MIVDLIGDGTPGVNPYRPDTDLLYTNWVALPDGRCKIELPESELEKIRITALQGIRELKSRTLPDNTRLYDAVKNAVDASSNEDLQDFFYRASHWYKNTPEIEILAQSFGVDKYDFFEKAKAQKERL
jgi:hypothetical protein